MAEHALGGVVRQVAARLTTQLYRELSDRQLLERFLHQHDEGAFAVLVGRHERRVCAALGRVLTDPADIEDAFQATFLVRTLARRGSGGAVERKTESRVSIQADQSAIGDLPDLQRTGRTSWSKPPPWAETGDQILPIGRKRQRTDHASVFASVFVAPEVGQIGRSRQSHEDRSTVIGTETGRSGMGFFDWCAWGDETARSSRGRPTEREYDGGRWGCRRQEGFLWENQRPWRSTLASAPCSATSRT
jgi:hypothetical protein